MYIQCILNTHVPRKRVFAYLYLCVYFIIYTCFAFFCESVYDVPLREMKVFIMECVTLYESENFQDYQRREGIEAEFFR